MEDINPGEIESALRSAHAGDFTGLFAQFRSHFWYQGSDLSQESARIANDLNDRNEIDLLALILALPRGDTEHIQKAQETFFWASLPALQAPTSDIIAGIKRLVEIGVLPADDKWYSEGFYKWCQKEAGRPDGVVADALSDATVPSHGLISALVAGLENEPAKFINFCITAIEDPRTNVRFGAIRALGLAKAIPSDMIALVLDALESVISSAGDPDEKGEALTSELLIFSRYVEISETDIAARLATARASMPPEQLRLVGANALFRQGPDLRSVLFDTLVSWLEETAAGESGTINTLDHAFYRFAPAVQFSKLIELLAKLLIANQELSLTRFSGFISALTTTYPEHQNLLVFNWLKTGNPSLCRAVGKLISHHGEDLFRMSFDMAAAGATPAERLLICRRVMGNAMHMPLACASILLAAMEGADDATRVIIANWLLSPLLLNFSGELQEYLRNVKSGVSSEVSAELEKVLAAFDEYRQNLVALGRVKEFEPSESHRFMALERRNTEMDEASENSEYKSPLADLFPRRIILWGGKPIVHVYGSKDAKPTRTVMPLQTHSFSYEFPRLAALDPVGQNYQIFNFSYTDGAK